MNKFEIPEINRSKFETAIERIQRKCARYGCHFECTYGDQHWVDYNVGGGVYEPVKVFDVFVEGTVIAESGWRVIALVEHRDAGNVIRQFDFAVNIPDRYIVSDPVCEHCGSRRNRVQTWLLWKAVTYEWKQVGTSCLKDFTGDLTAERVAALASIFSTLDGVEQLDVSGIRNHHSYPTLPLLLIGAACIRKWGYKKADTEDPTGCKALRFYKCATYPESMGSGELAECREANLQVNDPEVVNQVAAARYWILNADTQGDAYLTSLKTLVSSPYVSARDVVMLVSLIPTYTRHVEELAREARRQQAHEAEMVSQHVGDIGDKVSVDVESAKCITSWDTQYGTSYMYKFVSVDHDVFIWITSKGLDCDRIVNISGTVKDHNEYDGVKQTYLTRCKVVVCKNVEEEPHEPANHDIDEALDMLYTEV